MRNSPDLLAIQLGRIPPASRQEPREEIERRCDRSSHRHRHHSGDNDAPSNAPAHGRDSSSGADADDRPGDRVRGRDRDPEKGGEEQRDRTNCLPTDSNPRHVYVIAAA